MSNVKNSTKVYWPAALKVLYGVIQIGILAVIQNLIMPKSRLAPGTTPIKLRPYKMNSVKQDVLHEVLQNLVKASVLELGTSPWGFPLLLAKKPGRDPSLPQSHRLLCDFRKLNDLLRIPSTSLPLTDSLLSDLTSGNSWFSIQYLTQGFLPFVWMNIPSNYVVWLVLLDNLIFFVAYLKV